MLFELYKIEVIVTFIINLSGELAKNIYMCDVDSMESISFSTSNILLEVPVCTLFLLQVFLFD